MISNPLILCSPSQNKRTTGRGQAFACQQILERHMFQVETKAKQPPSPAASPFLYNYSHSKTLNSDLAAHWQVISAQLASLLELLIAFPSLTAGHMHGQRSPGSPTARLTRCGSSGMTPALAPSTGLACRLFFLNLTGLK